MFTFCEICQRAKKSVIMNIAFREIMSCNQRKHYLIMIRETCRFEKVPNTLHFNVQNQFPGVTDLHSDDDMQVENDHKR